MSKHSILLIFTLALSSSLWAKKDEDDSLYLRHAAALKRSCGYQRFIKEYQHQAARFARSFDSEFVLKQLAQIALSATVFELLGQIATHDEIDYRPHEHKQYLGEWPGNRNTLNQILSEVPREYKKSMDPFAPLDRRTVHKNALRAYKSLRCPACRTEVLDSLPNETERCAQEGFPTRSELSEVSVDTDEPCAIHRFASGHKADENTDNAHRLIVVSSPCGLESCQGTMPWDTHHEHSWVEFGVRLLVTHYVSGHVARCMDSQVQRRMSNVRIARRESDPDLIQYLIVTEGTRIATELIVGAATRLVRYCEEGFKQTGRCEEATRMENIIDVTIASDKEST